MMPSVAVLVVLLSAPLAIFGQDATPTTAVIAQPVCSVNQLFNGQICTCAPGSLNTVKGSIKVEDEMGSLEGPNAYDTQSKSKFNPIAQYLRYFSSANDESKSRCEDECEEVYYSFFTYGKCVGDIFGKLPRDQQPACNLRCGVGPTTRLDNRRIVLCVRCRFGNTSVHHSYVHCHLCVMSSR
ncbi:hypothetical protein GCK32_009800 [Trichostrongylus colubriformis]|uniref:WSC domain-containing protein n=1 Tax=Trichostrongylus colubriformis TaxID=6319 RepID=A0AAN8ESY4_TRICO